VLNTYGAHLRSEKLSGAFNVGLVLRQSADAGNSQQIFQFGKEARLILPRIL
jgi:hypothetical protein